MGYKTKVQMIRRKYSKQWYINLSSALAQSMGFKKGEVVEWEIEDRYTLILKRKVKKKGGRRK